MSSRIFSVSDTNLVFLSQAKLIFSALERFVQPGPGLVPLPTCVLPQGENQVIRLSAVNDLQDFLEVLSQLHSPNHVPHGISQIGKPFGLIQIPLKTASLDDLIERFAELSRAEPHIGVSPGAPSGDDPSLTLEQERYQLGLKVLDMDHAPLSQEVRQGKAVSGTLYRTFSVSQARLSPQSPWLCVRSGTRLSDNGEGQRVLQRAQGGRHHCGHHAGQTDHKG